MLSTVIENLRVGVEYKEDLQALINKMIELKGSVIESIYLYGSAARGDMVNNSDLNIGVIAKFTEDEREELEINLRWNAISEIHSGSSVVFDITLLTYEKFKESYAYSNTKEYKILMDGILLWGDEARILECG